MSADTLPIRRRLTDPERSLLAYLAVWVVVEQTGATKRQAVDALEQFAERGETVIEGDDYDVYLKVAGRVLVHISREDLAFTALMSEDDT
jgi:hypothetical protein